MSLVRSWSAPLQKLRHSTIDRSPRLPLGSSKTPAGSCNVWFGIGGFTAIINTLCCSFWETFIRKSDISMVLKLPFRQLVIELTVYDFNYIFQFSSFQSLGCVQLFATPWTAARQASLSFSISWNLLIFMSLESVMLSNHFILCCPLLLLPSIFPSIRVCSLVDSLHEVVKVLELQLQHQSFPWIFRVDFL